MNTYSVKKFIEKHKTFLTILAIVALIVLVILIEGCALHVQATGGMGKKGLQAASAMKEGEGAGADWHQNESGEVLSKNRTLIVNRPARD